MNELAITKPYNSACSKHPRYPGVGSHQMKTVEKGVVTGGSQKFTSRCVHCDGVYRGELLHGVAAI